MQVDPIKPTLKAPGNKRLNLESDEQLSSFAFKFNLRCYILACTAPAALAAALSGPDSFSVIAAPAIIASAVGTSEYPQP